MFIGFNLGFFPMHRGRPAGYAASHIYLCAAHGLEYGQHGHIGRIIRFCRRHFDISGQLLCQSEARRCRRLQIPGMRRRSNGQCHRRRRLTILRSFRLSPAAIRYGRTGLMKAQAAPVLNKVIC